MEKERNTPEQQYQEFWKEIIEKDGVIDIEQVKKELHDFSFIIDQVSEVYSAVSQGLLSKSMYYASVIIEQLEENFYDKGTTNDDMASMISGCSDLEELKESLIDYFNITEEELNKKEG